MPKIKMTKEGASFYLIFCGALLLILGDKSWIGAFCLGLGLLTLIIMIKYPNRGSR